MVHETASRNSPLAPQTSEPLEASAHEVRPVGLPLLVPSVILIGIGALFVCGLLAAGAVLALFLRTGLEGVSDYYQELRFNIPLQTEIGAALISCLYIGVAVATFGAALVKARGRWPELVAWTRIRGGKRPSVGIFLLTIAYAATATLTMTLLQDHRVVVSGPTDIALLATISANLVILAPCAEELFFRGWLYTALRYRLSFWPSYLLTATLFAAIHWDPNHRRIFLVLPLALALGLLREITGSIKPTIALHGLYNLIIVAITLLEA